jgi:hypothetical protein
MEAGYWGPVRDEPRTDLLVNNRVNPRVPALMLCKISRRRGARELEPPFRQRLDNGGEISAHEISCDAPGCPSMGRSWPTDKTPVRTSRYVSAGPATLMMDVMPGPLPSRRAVSQAAGSTHRAQGGSARRHWKHHGQESFVGSSGKLAGAWIGRSAHLEGWRVMSAEREDGE